MRALQGQARCSGSGPFLMLAIAYIFNKRQIICEWKDQASVFLLAGGQQLCLLTAVTELLRTTMAHTGVQRCRRAISPFSSDPSGSKIGK